ncbi:MAG: hypothetical protein E6G85_09225 [Alphaproteobacteria bacterium]|nr:MAG: hypothetical protein E6G85_09225 [Alphaproteobacteria bacterium]
MSPLDPTSQPNQGDTQKAAVAPWVCISFYIFAVLWFHATFTSQISLAVVFFSALFSSIAGFAFSPLAGSVLFHVEPDPVLIVKILLVASIALQIYCTWRLRGSIKSLELVPYLVGSLATLPLGLLLLLHAHTTIYLPILGGLLIAYGMLAMVKPVIRAGGGNSLVGRIAMGALGGLTGGLAAFPGAFIAIWCQAQGFSKERQRSLVQPFILINQLCTFAALAFLRPIGTISVDLFQYAPPAVLGAYMGLHLFERLSTAGFNRIVGLFLLLSGVVMAAKSF